MPIYKVSGATSVTLSIAFLTIMALLIKAVPLDTGAWFLVGARGIGNIGLSVLFMLIAGSKVILNRDVLLRGLFGSLAISIYFYNIKELGASYATFLNNFGPVFVFLISITVLKVKMKLYDIIGIILLCFATGFYLSSTFKFEKVEFVVLGFVGAFFAGCAFLYLKRSMNSSNKLSTLFVLGVYLIVLGFFLKGNEELPAKLNLHTSFFVIAIVVCSFLGQYFMNQAYQHLDSAIASASIGTLPLFIAISEWLLGWGPPKPSMLLSILCFVLGLWFLKKQTRKGSEVV